jgi:hypothetical protein
MRTKFLVITHSQQNSMNYGSQYKEERILDPCGLFGLGILHLLVHYNKYPINVSLSIVPHSNEFIVLSQVFKKALGVMK